MSPCIFAFTSLPLLLSICFFWFLHLSASSFFGWLYLHFSSNCLFPSDSWSLQAWMVDYCILPVFCVCSSHSSLLARLVPFFVAFVTARNTFHVRLWHPAMTAPSVSWRLWRVLVSICYPVLRVANHVLSSTCPLGISFRRAMLMGGSSYRRSAVTVQPSNSIIWTSPRSAKCPGQVLDEQNWPIIIN